MSLGDDLIEQFTQYNGFTEAIEELEDNVESIKDHTPGCYLYKGGSVWFNKHENGSKHSGSAPICVIKGNLHSKLVNIFNFEPLLVFRQTLNSYFIVFIQSIMR